MTEKKPRRSSLIGSLRILGKSPFSSHHHKDVDRDSKSLASPPSAGGTASRKLSWPSIGRSSTRTVSDGHRSTISTTSTGEPVHIPNDHGDKVAFPKLRATGATSRTRLLSSRTQRFSSSSNVSLIPAIPPAQTSMPCLNRRWSRIPTPSYLPDGAGYSHVVFKQEGRKRVRSSIGTSLRKSCIRAGNVGEKHGAGELVPPHGKFREGRWLADESDTRALSLGDPYQGQVLAGWIPPTRKDLPRVFSMNSVEKASSRLRTMIPLPKSGSMLSVHAGYSSDRRRSPSLNGASQITGLKRGEAVQSTELNNQVSNENAEFQSDRGRPNLRKVRVKLQSLPGCPRRQFPDNDTCTDIPPGKLENTMSDTKDEATQQKGLHSLRPREKLGPGVKRSRSEARPHNTTESKRKIKTDSSQIPLPTKSRVRPGGRPRRPRDPTERMVSEAQPRQYWLGRFVTLTNAFHYEDSFHEPDMATGFGMLSSYSRPLTHGDSDLANYRVKRAFMVLENVCVSEEASSSLRRFREQYIAKYGGRWIG